MAARKRQHAAYVHMEKLEGRPQTPKLEREIAMLRAQQELLKKRATKGIQGEGQADERVSMPRWPQHLPSRRTSFSDTVKQSPARR